ncbi:MAG: hypothetical protein JSS96_15075, partial [Bacteroidetes bacterium]|nr:hypothetical protein [Bacteroidota bacterium]
SSFTFTGIPLNLTSWTAGTIVTTVCSKDGDAYRYGFNGQLKDNEWAGIGNHMSTEFRQYDSRLGRWLSVDPLMAKFPSWSPYVFAFDNPIQLNDPKGDAPPTIKEIYQYGKTHSLVFASLLTSARITETNYSDKISFGERTYTRNSSGYITLKKDNDIKFEVIQLSHELTNRKNILEINKAMQDVGSGKITPKEYATKLNKIEYEGEINQIKVAAEIGYIFKGKGMEKLNGLVSEYKKDNTIDLEKRLKVNESGTQEYEEAGQKIRDAVIKANSEENKTTDTTKK